jgi:hypothetical protein
MHHRTRSPLVLLFSSLAVLATGCSASLDDACKNVEAVAEKAGERMSFMACMERMVEVPKTPERQAALDCMAAAKDLDELRACPEPG